MSKARKFWKSLLDDDSTQTEEQVTNDGTPSYNNSTSFPTQDRHSFPEQVKNNVYTETTTQMQQFVAQQPTVTQTYSPPIQPIQNFGVVTPQPIQHINNCDAEVQKVLAEYEQHLDRVNQAGYDFYEFYKAIMVQDPNNPTLYPIVFNVAKTFDNTLTAQRITESGQFYIDEMDKAYQNFKDQCEQQISVIQLNKDTEVLELQDRLKSLQDELQRVQMEIQSVSGELNMIDSKYIPELEKAQCFNFANETIYKQMVDSLTKVKNNINF